jgi:UDP-glucose 4-epimerase
MTSKSILVTGGLGFVGSHLVDFLLKDPDNKITVIDNLCSESSSKSYMREHVDYIVEDVRNLSDIRYANLEFDVIYHLAALARIQPSFKDPLKYLSIDILGTSHVCELARRCKSKLVYAGSSSAFAGPMLNPYAFAKYTGEQVCEMFNNVYGLRCSIARFFNVYGDRQPTSGPYATVVGVFEKQFMTGIPLTITGSGEQRRDFTHVSDIVAGLEKMSKDPGNCEMYQLGTGKNYSINELANFFGSKIEYIEKRPGEAWITLADNKKAKSELSWSPLAKLSDYIEQQKVMLR